MIKPRKNTDRPSGAWTFLFALTAAMTLLGTVGCRQEVQTSYIPPTSYDRSLNGISVFNTMTTRRGHALRTEMVVNSYAKNCDVLVWFARRTGAPNEETVKQIENWLTAKPGRTFVYVGRALESTADYWTAVEEQALAPTEEDRQKIASRKLDAENNLRSFLAGPNRNSEKKGDEKKNDRQDAFAGNPLIIFDDDNSRWIGKNTECSWFETARRQTPYKVTAISGSPEWTNDIDAGRLHLTCYEDWDFADDVEPLLIVRGEEIEDRTLVARKKVGESRAIFVVNAGFLLNYPLVNHEHRKLAGRLIDTFGTPKKLFGRSTGVRVCVYIGTSEINFDKSNEVSEESPHVLLTLLHIWPLSVILCHLIVLCTAYCFYKWPILGRPRKLAESPVTDFGKHIDAYAALLAEAKDDDYTLKQITDASNMYDLTAGKQQPGA